MHSLNLHCLFILLYNFCIGFCLCLAMFEFLQVMLFLMGDLIQSIDFLAVVLGLVGSCKSHKNPFFFLLISDITFNTKRRVILVHRIHCYIYVIYKTFAVLKQITDYSNYLQNPYIHMKKQLHPYRSATNYELEKLV